MNILPKKRWHVRTKENVARVRRDQKRAAEEAERVAERAKLAEQEFKINMLRKNAEKRFTDFYGVQQNDGDSVPIVSSSGHVNFFADLEEETRKNYGTSNKEYEEERRKEQEEFESKVGILKYLGEGSNEYTKQKSWYEEVPKRAPKKDDESKKRAVPTIYGIRDIADERHESDGRRQKDKKYGRKSKHKHRHRRSHDKREKESDEALMSDESSPHRTRKLESRGSTSRSLEKLREERLRREEVERQKTQLLLLGDKHKVENKVPQVYNSQFNPELARQNHHK